MAFNWLLAVSGHVLVQKRPTTHPKDYIESFTRNFPDIKVRSILFSCSTADSSCLHCLS